MNEAISITEVVNMKRGKRRSIGKKKAYRLLAISKTVLGERSKRKMKYFSDTRIVFYVTPELMKKAHLATDTLLDFKFQYSERLGMLIPVTTDASRLRRISKKSFMHTITFSYIAGFNFPLVKEGLVPIPENVIHINRQGIVFSLRGMDGKFIYEGNYKEGGLNNE
jgi:hypothetical protein